MRWTSLSSGRLLYHLDELADDRGRVALGLFLDNVLDKCVGPRQRRDPNNVGPSADREPAGSLLTEGHGILQLEAIAIEHILGVGVLHQQKPARLWSQAPDRGAADCLRHAQQLGRHLRDVARHRHVIAALPHPGPRHVRAVLPLRGAEVCTEEGLAQEADEWAAICPLQCSLQALDCGPVRLCHEERGSVRRCHGGRYALGRREQRGPPARDALHEVPAQLPGEVQRSAH
mmetsp:Transcript_119665/g.334000  ORF Transcript_119665/g.334000 Transcript_119665/m.334000 type:complete len:231 (+) Transcript_119665:197-889(+)